jgi:restriction endonuclease S subunit
VADKKAKKPRKKRVKVALTQEQQLQAEQQLAQRKVDNPELFNLPDSKRTVDELTDYFVKVEEGSNRILPIEKRRYVIYLRKSTDDEAKQVRSLPDQRIECLELNLPSILEQRKISKILTTADSVIEKTQVAIAKYKVIKQGMLQDLFTRGIDITTNQLRPRFEDAPHLYKESKLGMIPVEWDEKVFGKEVDLIHGHQFRDYDFTEFGIPVVKIGQVKPENVDLWLNW